jgi:hypothetical protein
VWQAEDAVANLPLRLAVRAHCDQPSVAGYSRGTHSLQGHTGVLTAYSAGAHSLYGYTATGQSRCVAVGRARRPSLSCVLERVCEWPNDRMCWLQGLELLVTVLLARNRQPLPAVAAVGPHAELAAELVSLPSGLLAMVCEAIGKLKVRLGAA